MKLQLIFDEKPRGGGGIGASAQIAKTLHQQGIDTTTLLYDEALELATSGDFSSATERLQMLLCLNPSDGGSHFLLAKTLAAKKEWQQAIYHLKKSAENGQKIPKDVRSFIDQGLQRELRNTDIERKRALQRDRSELNQLKNEIKRLRSKNSSLNNENVSLANNLRLWMYLSAIISGSSLAILTYLFVQDNQSAEDVVQIADLNEQEKIPEETTNKSDLDQNPPLKTTTKKSKPKKLKTKKPSKPKTAKPTAEKQSRFPLTHIIGKNDSYSKMAEKYYGSHRKWKQIQDHNGIPANGLKRGQKISIPAPK